MVKNRKLSANNKVFASESLGMAFSHFKIAQTLYKQEEYSASIARLYYAGFFGAQAALAELGRRSKKHKYWVGEFNKKFGKGKSWIPKLYVKTLNELRDLREDYDYSGIVPNDEMLAKPYLNRLEILLNKIKKNTPLLLYPEFIKTFFYRNLFMIDALEFDFYCPKSYLHKERIQFQIMSQNYDEKYFKKINEAGKNAIKKLNANRQDDYVLGWNNRLGQSGDAYVLFLDLDENDEAKVKRALKNRKGWLFKSGEGYHFIGVEIYKSREQWLYRYKTASNSKNLKDIVDQLHVDFSERRGYSTLRVMASENKPFTPFMCWDNSR